MDVVIHSELWNSCRRVVILDIIDGIAAYGVEATATVVLTNDSAPNERYTLNEIIRQIPP